MKCHQKDCFAYDNGDCIAINPIIRKGCPFYKTRSQAREDRAKKNNFKSKCIDCWKAIYDQKGSFIAAKCNICGHFFLDENVIEHKVCPDCLARVK